jgi:glycerophosphoryl diester phosphodiesterase
MREAGLQAKLYGHRGARGERPENTIDGFLYAASLGLAGIETDIAMTADFVPVLHHDAALPDGRLIKEMNFADLPAPIPSLEAALRAVPGSEWLLEIKTYPGNPEQSHSPEIMVAKTLPILAGIGWERLCVLAFDWAVLREISIQAPRLRRVCLTAPDTEAIRELWWGPGFATRDTPGAVAATGAYAWAPLHTSLSEAEILAARALGLKIFAWTVNERPDFDRLAPLADGIITDYPARFTQNMVA